MKLSFKVTGIDPDKKMFTLNNEESIAWSKLVIATSSKLRCLDSWEKVVGLFFCNQTEEVAAVKKLIKFGARIGEKMNKSSQKS